MPRRNRKRRAAPAGSLGAAGLADLYVPLPPSPSSSNTQHGEGTIVMVARLLDRLHELGYAQVALTHTVYGRPKLEVDAAAQALPVSLWQQSRTKKNTTIQVLRRLHIVVETLADTGLYTSTAAVSNNNSEIHGLLRDYDLVSLQPRNDACFQAACAACNSNNGNVAFDILTLDTVNCKLRATDVKSATVNGGTALEVLYAHAVVNHSTSKPRRTFVQTCRMLHNASQHVNRRASFGANHILVSSGPRLVDNTAVSTNEADAGPRALRSSSDVTNLVETVGGLKIGPSNKAAAMAVLNRARRRKLGIIGNSSSNSTNKKQCLVQVESVSVVQESELLKKHDAGEPKKKKQEMQVNRKKAIEAGKVSKNDTETSQNTTKDQETKKEQEALDHGDDGFIAF